MNSLYSAVQTDRLSSPSPNKFIVLHDHVIYTPSILIKKACSGWVSYSIYQKTVSTTIFQQLVPQKAAKGGGGGGGVLRIIQKNS